MIALQSYGVRQHRTRLYAWLRVQTDEPLAEYLMACLAPAPLSDLVTRDHLAAVVSRLATKDEMNAGFAALRNEHATQRAEDAAQRTEDRAEHASRLAGPQMSHRSADGEHTDGATHTP